ncbi:hypothetical protein A8709_04490 [Paenibacillus pectinilyticus]|uniref:Uncharacterized protein n=1 Tax=Paenibacillus pectinilyticus TaxID=512399 RepID=A0A1C0ZSC4_9BACL|nr:hypothetical protein [Paenibacillus pectinilyticus]OCT10967.1 hypothetical protein A8709_04490 [Paenibacillus pectinilyticus]
MWFQKKKKSPPSRSPAPAAAAPKVPSPVRSEALPSQYSQPSLAGGQSQTVHLLEQRLRKLEEQLADLSAKHPRIHIDNLHVHQPVLENLTFRLDHLDIKELSGSLNLGNNFGAKPTAKAHAEEVDKTFQRAQVSKDSKTARSADDESDSAPHADSGPERTSTGYRYTPPAPPQQPKV